MKIAFQLSWPLCCRGTFFLLSCRKSWRKLIYTLRLYRFFTRQQFSYLWCIFINFNNFFSSFLNSARKGREIREDMAEVRPDPDIEDVNRAAAETSRPSELFVFRVCFSFLALFLSLKVWLKWNWNTKRKGNFGKILFRPVRVSFINFMNKKTSRISIKSSHSIAQKLSLLVTLVSDS